MDVFALRDRLVEDYASYTRSFSMEPAVHDGDRLLVDTGRKTPATGEMAVPRADPPRLRLISTNPAYDPYDCLAGEAHIAGTVIWTLRRV